MKAINKENQAALDEFCKNEFWRTYYENAPVIAREFIENGFRHSADPHGDDKIPKEERKRKYADLESRMTIDDLRYLADMGHHQILRKHFKDVLEKHLTSVHG